MGGNSASAPSQRSEWSASDPAPGSPPPSAASTSSGTCSAAATGPAPASRSGDNPAPGGGLKPRQASMALPGGGGGGGAGERRRQMSLAEPGARSSARPSVAGERAGRLSLIPGRGRQASLVEALGCVAGPEDDEEGAEPPPDLTDHEKELLTASWKEIESNVAQVGVITFIRSVVRRPAPLGGIFFLPPANCCADR
ncbi:hypothetical protein ONE63_004654 [Megalurothrips usitatus]|uniref:Uncharacterized protein n=1 Tax=Megalurothrips usitatus TaxID=439358 RepID=A0AAV7X473_9NEOP|nr:hypothetical protein ONE63_004654 [Megalurothrips usitatus]